MMLSWVGVVTVGTVAVVSMGAVVFAVVGVGSVSAGVVTGGNVPSVSVVSTESLPQPAAMTISTVIASARRTADIRFIWILLSSSFCFIITWLMKTVKGG